MRCLILIAAVVLAVAITVDAGCEHCGEDECCLKLLFGLLEKCAPLVAEENELCNLKALGSIKIFSGHCPCAKGFICHPNTDLWLIKWGKCKKEKKDGDSGKEGEGK
uniref:U43-Liphistoxin-Lsp1a_1 n=1 Tax=Liphistius sp. SGP-2016 TaxID=1905180 RepID=A0A4Q8K6B4_9ARAC